MTGEGIRARVDTRRPVGCPILFPSVFRPSVIASIGFAAAAAAGVLSLSLDRDDSSDLPPPPVVGGPARAGLMAETGIPVVDVVRIGELGDAMIAGRAEPKAEIAIFADDQELGRATADARGEWVFVPSLPFGAGARQLTLKSGARAAADAPVVVVVPEHDHSGAFAFQSAPGRASKLLQAPSAGIAAAAALTFALVDRDRDGRLYVSGRAEPESRIHLYVDNRYAGRVRADAAGAWRLAVPAPRRGGHTLRADQVDAKGKAILRVEQPWQPGDDLVGADKVMAVRTESGSWRVVRHTENGGTAYTMVYPAGRAQARDPDVIYPGQVFSGSPP